MGVLNSKKIAILSIILIILIGTNSYAQPKILSQLRKTKPSESYLLTSWNSNHGLPQNTINGIAQDSKGFIWLSTFGGLVRFDGVNFKVFSSKEYPVLSSDRITGLYIDKSDLIIIANESGQVLTFDGKKFIDITSQFNKPSVHYSFLGEDSKAGKYILADSLLYYYTQKGTVLIDFEKTFTSTKVNRHICSSSQMIGDSLFVIKDDISVILYHSKITKSVNFLSKNEFSNSCFVNSDGYWFLRERKLMFSKKFEDIKNAKNIFPGRKFISIYGRDNKIIASTWERELVSIENFQMSIIQERNRKIISLYSKLFIDKKNNYWVGSEIDGLFYIRKKFLYTLDKSFGINRLNTYPIFKASDNIIWIGQNYGLQRISNKKIEDFEVKKSVDLAPWAFAEDKNKNIWIASNGNGIFNYDGKKVTHFGDTITRKAGVNFFSAFRDKNNKIWFGGIGNIVTYKEGKFGFFKPETDIVNLYRAFIQDKDGIIWIASDNGLLKYDKGKFTPINELNLTSSRALYIDKKKRLWVGSYGKGIAIKEGTKFHYLSENEGLHSNIVSAIVEDSLGNFWFTSNSGLFRIRESEIESFLNGNKKNVISISYGTNEGLTNTEFNGGCQPSWMKDDEGNLWFPSFGGAVIVDIKALQNSSKIPEVIIESLKTKDSTYYADEKIILPATYSNLTITYKSPSFSSPQNVKFKYRLRGLEKEWHENGNKREITFQKLPYGNYEFEVMVTDEHGNSSKNAGMIKFTVNSVFYETPLFYIVVSLLIIAIISFLYFIKLRLARKDAAKLESLVNDRTISLQNAKEDAERLAEEEKILRAEAEEENRQKIELLRIVSHDLKNPVFAIKGFTEMLLEDDSFNEENKEIITMIGEAGERQKELITQLLNYSRYEGGDFALDKSHVNIINVIKRILPHFIQISANKNQEIHFDYENSEIYIFTDQALFSQIIENILSNAIKYSPKNKNIYISVQTREDKIRIKVRDEGPGFREEEKEIMYKPFVKLSAQPTGDESSTGLGLSIVKRFVELNGGSIFLNSTLGNGSEFILEFDRVDLEVSK